MSFGMPVICSLSQWTLRLLPGWLRESLGLPGTSPSGDNPAGVEVQDWRWSFASDWAAQQPWLVAGGVIGALLLAGLFYFRGQPVQRRLAGGLLTLLRGLVLGLIVVILADPILELSLVEHPRPLLWVLLDRSESMQLAAGAEEFSKLTTTGSPAVDSATTNTDSAVAPSPTQPTTRSQQVQTWLATAEATSDAIILPVESALAQDTAAPSTTSPSSLSPGQVLRRLATDYDLRIFSFSEASSLQNLVPEAATSDGIPDFQQVSQQYQVAGTTTAIGAALDDLARQQPAEQLAGVLLVSDFDQNSGPPPLTAARRLGVPVYTVGLGPLAAPDLSVELLVPPTMKKGEASTITVTVRQQELEGVSTTVTVTAIDTTAPADDAGLLIGTQTVVLTGERDVVEFPLTPATAGRYRFVAQCDALPEEVVTENNRHERTVRIIDDFLRLMFVEYEPTWEWRFVKEVFHRDRLVGQRGFRTYLRSSDPVVRENNPLFLPSLTMQRSDFFETDVIFLGDLPASALSSRFCEMTKEFVSQFGGGLVVMGGPRFGIGELAETPLADILPVVVESQTSIRSDRPFRLQLTPLAGQYDFMRLGQPAEQPFQGWNSLGELNWYQPVQRIDPRATAVLAEHPTDRCTDGTTPQPLIAIRKYGRGEVIYLAFNEFWRLRRLHGEEYYRQFWGQMIYRLGLSHALGPQKRFLVRTDRQRYRANEQVLVTVEAYDREFQPLSDADLPNQQLQAELLAPDQTGSAVLSSEMTIGQLRPGVFETRLPVSSGGQYRLRVTDPLSGEPAEVQFEVADVGLERRTPVRNAALQKMLAAETGGRAYELGELPRLLDDFQPAPRQQVSLKIISLWSHWLTFAVAFLCLMLEWSVRKWMNLA